MKSLEWLFYGTDYILRQKFNSIYKVPYSSREMLSNSEANLFLTKKIKEGVPFFAGRFGHFELAQMRAFEFKHKDKYELVMKQIYECAGFFPLDISYGNKFLNTMTAALQSVDLLACSGQVAENYFINKYSNGNAKLSRTFAVMEPWLYEIPWSSALKGKKVLVVNPFEESIQEQYQKREFLFQGTEILPEFELLTFQALQTTGDLTDERFLTWFDALEYMYQEIDKKSFDIALLGCGAYGFPLAAKIKQSGRQAIHVGGVLQLLFGIMGKRWDGTGPNSPTGKMIPEIATYYNEYWTYPKASETPVSANKVEYGPYWR